MSRVLYALIGAVLAVVFSFVPFSPALGGAVAGFLAGPNERSGVTTGALSGLFTLLPLGLIAVFFVTILGLGFGLAAVPAGGAVLVLLVLAVLATLVVAYTVGAGALGGFLGAALAREYPDRWREAREALGSPVPRGGDFEAFDPSADRFDDDRETDDRREYERFDR